MSRRQGPEDLLATAARVLREKVAAGLSGDARYQALMVANAIAIAGRQMDDVRLRDPGHVPAAEDPASLVDAIRSGAVDGRADVHEWILRELRAKVAVSNPKALTRETVDDAIR